MPSPLSPNFESRVRQSFSRQTVMQTIGATLVRVEPGLVEVSLPFRTELCQQHGFLHAGVVTTVVDSACGYAALSLMPEDAGVLSIEFKVNLFSPAVGERFTARGRVVKSGRTIVVCEGELIAHRSGEEKTVAMMVATMMTVRDRSDVKD